MKTRKYDTRGIMGGRRRVNSGRLSQRLPVKLDDALRTAAAKRGVAVSEVVRQALAEHLGVPTGQQAPQQVVIKERYVEIAGDRLWELLAGRRVTDVAVAAGMHPATLYRYLRGDRQVPMRQFIKLMEVLEVSWIEL